MKRATEPRRGHYGKRLKPRIGARGGHVVRLCIGCLLEWFPGRSPAWLEERLDYYIDHVDYGLAVAQWKETQRTISNPKTKPQKPDFVVKVPPLKRKEQK